MSVYDIITMELLSVFMGVVAGILWRFILGRSRK
jgi:hypothetical protein